MPLGLAFGFPLGVLGLPGEAGRPAFTLFGLGDAGFAFGDFAARGEASFFAVTPTMRPEQTTIQYEPKKTDIPLEEGKTRAESLLLRTRQRFFGFLRKK